MTLAISLAALHAIELFQGYTLPALASIDSTVTSSGGPYSTQVQILLERIGMCSPKLSCLELSVEERIALPLNLLALSPLQGCSLHTLTITGEVTFDINDADLCTLVSNMPLLNTLHLLPDQYEHILPLPTTDLTLNVLEMLARIRPTLSDIRLFINSHQGNPSARRTNPEAPYAVFQHAVNLDFGDSYIRKQDVMVLAMWLSGVFSHNEVNFGGFSGTWAEVEDLCGSLRLHTTSLMAPKLMEIENLQGQVVKLKDQLEELEGKMER